MRTKLAAAQAERFPTGWTFSIPVRLIGDIFGSRLSATVGDIGHADKNIVIKCPDLDDLISKLEADTERVVNEAQAEAETGKNADYSALGVFQTRFQPAGSPPPGDGVILARWIADSIDARLAENADAAKALDGWCKRLVSLVRAAALTDDFDSDLLIDALNDWDASVNAAQEAQKGTS